MSITSAFRTILAERSLHRVRLVVDGGFTPSVPSLEQDTDEHAPEANEVLESPYAEGQSFGICYVNSQGVESIRRITVWALRRSSESKLLLFAKCAETSQMKSFRADRIRYCVDVNGEVFEPPIEFLVEIFGLSSEDAALIESARNHQEPARKPPDTVYKAIKNQLKHELTILSAMSGCDGKVAFSETVVILEFARNQALSMGLELDEDREKKLTGFIRRLRATEVQIAQALDYLGRMPSQAQLAVVVACSEVMYADGNVREEEEALLEKVRCELLGC